VFRRSYKYCRFRVAVFRYPTVRKRGPPGGPTFLEAPPDTNSSATCGKTKHGNPTSGPTSHGHPSSSCTSQQAIRNVSSPSILFFRKNNSAVVHLQTRETPGPLPPFHMQKQIGVLVRPTSPKTPATKKVQVGHKKTAFCGPHLGTVFRSRNADRETANERIIRPAPTSYTTSIRFRRSAHEDQKMVPKSGPRSGNTERKII